MSKTNRTVVAVLVTLLSFFMTGALDAAEYEGEVNGAWMNVETINVEAYGVEPYLEYLGKGYIPMLEKVKAEELILDYGILVKTTGALGDADVTIWWAVASLDKLEKAGDRMDELASEMRPDEEWAAMQEKIAQIRTPATRDLYRSVQWSARDLESE